MVFSELHLVLYESLESPRVFNSKMVEEVTVRKARDRVIWKVPHEVLISLCKWQNFFDQLLQLWNRNLTDILAQENLGKLGLALPLSKKLTSISPLKKNPSSITFWWKIVSYSTNVDLDPPR